VENICSNAGSCRNCFSLHSPDYPQANAGKSYEINPSEPLVESYDDKLMKNLMR
jgi:hypothetical protein